jgi:hypothetical protein
VRTGLEGGERRRGCSGWVGVTLASNPNHEEGESGGPRLAPAPVREGEHLELKREHRVGLNRPDVVQEQ